MAGIRSAEEIALDVLDAYRLGEFLRPKLSQAIQAAQAEALEWAADYCDGNCHAPDCEGGDRRDLCPPCKMTERFREEAQRIREGR